MHTHAHAEALIEFLALCRLHYQPIINLDSPDCTLWICVWHVREKQSFALLKQGERPVKHSMSSKYFSTRTHTAKASSFTQRYVSFLRVRMFFSWGVSSTGASLALYLHTCIQLLWYCQFWLPREGSNGFKSPKETLNWGGICACEQIWRMLLSLRWN